jgi:hypothetical protein
MFIKLDHFTYINENKKGSNVVGTKLGHKKTIDSHSPHHDLRMIIVPIIYSTTYNESGIIMAFPQNLMKVGVLKFEILDY